MKITSLPSLFCILLLSVSATFALSAQQTTIDFETPADQFTGFGGTVFTIVADPQQSGNMMGQLVNAGVPWEGAFIDLPAPALLDTQKIIQLDFYNPGGTQQVLLKLEQGQNGDVEVTQTVQAAGWTNLQFDFSQASIPGGGGTVNASGTYSKMVIFVNGPQSQAGTYAVDDIQYSNITYSLDVIYNQLVWADEFNGQGAVDTAEWFSEVVPPNAWGWFNGESQHYTDRLDNAYQGNGHLTIVAKKETFSAYGLTLDYTSARLNSNFSFTYGRVDVRAKLPRGDGTWPAIWMLGTSIGNNIHPTTIPWPACGEIDIMEHWGNDQDRIHGSIHTTSSHGATVNTGSRFMPFVSDSFHVYSMNWSPNQIAFMIDDEIYYVYDPQVKNAATWPFDDPQFILLNVAMGSSFYTIDPNFVQSEMEVDYVRVYQQSGMGQSEEGLVKSVRVFPQPASDFIQVDGQSITDFEIVDMKGQTVKKLDLKGQSRPVIDVSDLATGVYVWKAVDINRAQQGKMLISR